MTEKALKPIKPFLNYEEQINNLIEQKGMIVNDHKFAGKRLNFRHGYKNPRPHFCNRSTLIIHI